MGLVGRRDLQFLHSEWHVVSVGAVEVWASSVLCQLWRTPWRTSCQPVLSGTREDISKTINVLVLCTKLWYDQSWILIYKGTCKLCDKTYYGETGDNGVNRIKQHRKSILKKDSGNAFAKHLQIEHPDLRAGRVYTGMFSRSEPDISWVIISSSSLGQISLPLLLSRIFFKTSEISFRFLTAPKVRELQRRAPPVSIELSKT